LPADRFLEIRYEELVADCEPLTRKMIGFCDLDWDEACLHSGRNWREVRTASVSGRRGRRSTGLGGASASLRALAGGAA
jgi:hypothetical protein